MEVLFKECSFPVQWYELLCRESGVEVIYKCQAKRDQPTKRVKRGIKRLRKIRIQVRD